MCKTLIVAMALSLVLVSGGLFSAQADCGLNPCGWRLNLNPCNWNLNPCSWNLNPCGWRLSSCFSCGSRDADRQAINKPAVSNDNNMDTGRY